MTKRNIRKRIGINTNIVVSTTTKVEVKTYTGWAKSFSKTVQEGCCNFLEFPVPYTKHCTWWIVTCVTCNGGSLTHTYCKGTSCTFPWLPVHLTSCFRQLQSDFPLNLCLTSLKNILLDSPCILAYGDNVIRSVSDFMIPPWCKCSLRYSDLLHSVDW
jgi:hypothetical protein